MSLTKKLLDPTACYVPMQQLAMSAFSIKLGLDPHDVYGYNCYHLGLHQVQDITGAIIPTTPRRHGYFYAITSRRLRPVVHIAEDDTLIVRCKHKPMPSAQFTRELPKNMAYCRACFSGKFLSGVLSAT